MGNRKRKNSFNTEKPDLIKSLANLSLEEITALNKTVPTLLQSKLQQMATSDNVEDIMKANLYLDANSRQDTKMKSVFFDPNDLSDTGRGYKGQKGVLSFETLRRMGDIFIVRSVVNTRVEQVQNFLHFSLDEQREGYTIRKKRSLLDKKDSLEKEFEDEDPKKIEYIINFLENGGLNEKWSNFDTFQDFGRKIVFDSLTLDQLAFEITRDKKWDLARFRAVDAALIRLLDSADPKQREAFEKYRFKGYLPRYCMAWQGQILQNPTTHEHVIYYPWELGYGVRNKSTSIYRNGYGTSELETLVEIITWILWGMQYNGNFFSKGSQPKGFINVKNQNIDNATLNEFRQAWTQTMRGVSNCLTGSSEITIEDKGLVSLESYLGDSEVKQARVWTGKKFEDGQVYKTGLKKKCSMKLANGLKVESSPDHRFKVISDEGVIEWKKRSELKIGDFVLCNKNSVEKSPYELPYEYRDFWSSPVIKLTEYGYEEVMFDVEIYDNEHQFIVNGILSHNSHRVPIMQGIDLEWIDLQKSNRDMEFTEWTKFLIIITCSVYRMDPSELGFQFQDQAQVFGQDGQKQRLEHSKAKGLKPLLIFMQNIINKFIVSEIDEGYEFVFTGIENDNEAQQVELDKKKTEAGFVSMEDMFRKYSKREFDPENDTILNSIYQTARATEQQQEMYAEPVPGEESLGEGDPFDQYKSIDNPILQQSLDYYVNKLYGDK